MRWTAMWLEFTIIRSPQGRSKEGKITKVLEHELKTVVGLYHKRKGKSYGFVLPDNLKILKDIFVPAEKDKVHWMDRRLS